MTREQILRIMAGFFVLLSLGLGADGSPIFHHSNWLWFTAFVGLNLFQRIRSELLVVPVKVNFHGFQARRRVGGIQSNQRVNQAT